MHTHLASCDCAAHFVVESKFNIETKVIVVDFSGGKEIYAEIRPQLSGLDIGVLGERECVHVCVRVCEHLTCND